MKIVDKIKGCYLAYRKNRLYKQMNRINSNPHVYKIWEHSSWGDNIYIRRINKNHSFRIVGWLQRRPANGDKLLYKVESGKTAVGYIINVEYCRDPRDMFFADVVPYELSNLKKGGE